jgi:cysteine desulfurase
MDDRSQCMERLVDNIMKKIYLDYAATTPTHPDVLKVMLPYFTDHFGNPSSIHSYGQETKIAVEEARSKVAALINAREDEVIFTSSGTEANNLAIKGVAWANRASGNHIITSSIEHHSVKETCNFLENEGFTLTYLPVDEYGFVSPDSVKKAITNSTILISVMHANNEIGSIEPIKEIGEIAREHHICFHTDAVQTIGHIPMDVYELGIDLLSLSAHKFYGPKGIGALYARKGINLISLLHGGEQESGKRASTENVPGIVGLGKASELALHDMYTEMERQILLRDKLIKSILDKNKHVKLNGHPKNRLPNNVNISFENIEGESILLALNQYGICTSTGSACSSSSLEPSHVLISLGHSYEQAFNSLRFSLGKWTTEEEIDMVSEVLFSVVNKLRVS